MFINIIPFASVPKLLTYHVPAFFQSVIRQGSLVLVPMRGQQITGCVAEVDLAQPDIKVKDVIDVLSDTPVLTPMLLSLTQWIADYYICSWGEAVKLALPRGIEQRSGKIIRRKVFSEGIQLELGSMHREEMTVFEELRAKKTLFFSHLKKRYGEQTAQRIVKTLLRKDLVTVETRLLSPKVRTKFQTFYHYTGSEEFAAVLEEVRCRAPVQARLLEIIHEKRGVEKSQLLKLSKGGAASIHSLTAKELIREEKREVERLYPLEYDVDFKKPEKLTEDQQTVVNEILTATAQKLFAPILLFGVTGSGKTQVYIECLQQILQSGKTAIILVPEISLTAQAVLRFRAYFGDQVTFVHSRMSLGERYDAWRKIRQGEKSIVIGPRSAVFAPVENLGLIIVDEEHDESYKQQDTAPRYNARDVAIVLARMHQCPVVLGSATPSLDSFYHARAKKYRLLELPCRIDNVPLPEVRLVDLRKTKKTEGILSDTLIDKIQEHLDAGNQVMLLLNRRGYSTALFCEDCGYITQCPHCSIALTFHRIGAILKCHYCGFTTQIPLLCVKCGSSNIDFKGRAIQQAQEELQEKFPEVPVARMDADTTTGKGAHGRIASAFDKGAYKILIGTQMIAKGFDFPQVQLVGVILADIGLRLPDFRGTERTFQLLTQVAGRAGRRKTRGEVIIQTYLPDTYCISLALEHDFLNFYDLESGFRRQLGYPPFGRMAVLTIRGKDETQVKRCADLVYRSLNPVSFPGTIYDPVPAPLSRIKENYRWQIICKTFRKDAKKMRDRISKALDIHQKKNLSTVTVAVDIDPLSTL